MAATDAIGAVEGPSTSRVEKIRLLQNYYRNEMAKTYHAGATVPRDVAVAFVGAGSELGLFNNDYFYGPGEGNYNFGPKTNVGWQTNANGYTEEIPLNNQWIC